jgi:hypothetical protein
MDVATSEVVMEVVNSILEVKVVIQAEWHYILCVVNRYSYITICFKIRDQLPLNIYNGGVVCDIDGSEYLWYRWQIIIDWWIIDKKMNTIVSSEIII